MQNRKVLVIGGGIAGLVAALLLQRAGIEAEIFEARDAPEEYASSWLIMLLREEQPFLKRSPSPSALDWLYAYKVDWEAPVEATPGLTPHQEAATRPSQAR